jgi:taurine transport system permease protein
MAEVTESAAGVSAAAPDGRARTSRYRVLGEGSSVLISAVTIAVLFLVWWLATRQGLRYPAFSLEQGFHWGETPLLKPLFLPKPESIWLAFQQAMAGDLDNSTLVGHFFASLGRVGSAFVLAVLIGIPVGIAMGVSRIARGIFDPPLEFYRPLPPLAYLPLMIIWFGIGEKNKIILLFLAIFAPVALAARAGVRSVAQEQIQAALSMGASRMQVVRHVIVPGALPEILVGLRIGMGVGWTTLVAAEMVAADAGLGKMVYNASNFLRTDVVILGIVAIGFVAYAFELLMRWAERLLVPWKGRV